MLNSDNISFLNDINVTHPTFVAYTIVLFLRYS